MTVFVLKRKDGTYWGINSKYKNAVVFLTEGDAYLAWEAITTEDFEIVKCEIKELDKVYKIWDDDRTSGAV